MVLKCSSHFSKILICNSIDINCHYRLSGTQQRSDPVSPKIFFSVRYVCVTYVSRATKAHWWCVVFFPMQFLWNMDFYSTLPYILIHLSIDFFSVEYIDSSSLSCPARNFKITGQASWFKILSASKDKLKPYWALIPVFYLSDHLIG